MSFKKNIEKHFENLKCEIFRKFLYFNTVNKKLLYVDIISKLFHLETVILSALINLKFLYGKYLIFFYQNLKI